MGKLTEWKSGDPDEYSRSFVNASTPEAPECGVKLIDPGFHLEEFEVNHAGTHFSGAAFGAEGSPVKLPREGKTGGIEWQARWGKRELLQAHGRAAALESEGAAGRDPHEGEATEGAKEDFLEFMARMSRATRDSPVLGDAFPFLGKDLVASWEPHPFFSFSDAGERLREKDPEEEAAEAKRDAACARGEIPLGGCPDVEALRRGRSQRGSGGSFNVYNRWSRASLSATIGSHGAGKMWTVSKSLAAEVVHGAVRWLLYPPRAVPPMVYGIDTPREWMGLVYQELPEKEMPMECLQRPGEATTPPTPPL